MIWLPGETMSSSRGGTQVFKNISTSVLFPLRRLRSKSQPCKEEIRFFLSWYTLPCARNFKPLFEFQTLQALNYPAGTSELFPLAPTRIYVEIVHYVDIVLLERNYPTGNSELSPLGANSDLRRNCTLCKDFPAGVKFQIYVEIVQYIEIVPLA